MAFIPFVTLGDPNYEWSFEIIKTLIASGVSALELGFAFSDPQRMALPYKRAI